MKIKAIDIFVYEDNNTSMILQQFRKHSILTGVILTLIGLAGIILPPVMSLSLSFFMGVILFLSGILSAYQVYKSYNKKAIAWLKPFILVITGILIIINPVAGVAAIGIILAIYLLMDSFAGFSMLFELRELKGTFWLIANSTISLILAIILIAGWPTSSLLLIGLFVGISLFMDGITLLFLGFLTPKE